MNGTLINWIAHAGLALAIMALSGWALGSAEAGAVVAIVYFYAKEIGEFSAKHWDAPGRPWADLNPWHKRRTRDDRLDLFAPVAAVLIALNLWRLL